MLESAFVTLREGSECLLILWLLHSWSKKIRPSASAATVVKGAALGLFCALIVLILAFSWGEWSPRVTSAVNVLLGLGVLGLACTALASHADIHGHIANRPTNVANGLGQNLSLAGFAALAAFRETGEAGIFLHQIALEQGLWVTANGVVFGLVAAFLVALAFRSVQSRLPLLVVFHLSSLLLCLFAIKLTLAGVHGFLGPLAQSLPTGMVELLTPGNRAFSYLCLVLMIPPTSILARRWWRQASG